MRRIVVLGTSGSGKSTFAQQVAQRLSLRYVELDALHWEPNWNQAPLAVFRERISAAINGDDWIVDGNYSKVRDAIWPTADTFIWLDYSMTIVFTRVVRRTFRRWWKSEQLWSGNREELWWHFFTQNSLFLWVVQTWRIHRRDYPKMLQEQSQAGKRIVRLRHPDEAERWIANLKYSIS
jgi:adenylate kinase family enzyme